MSENRFSDFAAQLLFIDKLLLAQLQSNLNSSNTDGSFTMPNSK